MLIKKKNIPVSQERSLIHRSKVTAEGVKRKNAPRETEGKEEVKYIVFLSFSLLLYYHKLGIDYDKNCVSEGQQ